jgi:CheY-like chemotaxis protein
MELIKSNYRTVMLIEDNAIDLFIAEEIIKKNNFAESIITYKCALQAFHYIQSIKENTDLPNVIFTDINLGESSGFKFIDLFMTLPKSKTDLIKIFVVSSTVDPRDFEKIKSYNIKIGFKEKYIDQDFLNSI